MKLYEKLCFKLGTKVGSALYGGHLTPEEKRELERRVYQEKLAEERAKAAAARSYSGSTSSCYRAVCGNCHHFLTSPYFGYPYFCTKHDIKFSHDDIRDNVHFNSGCRDFSKKGYW